MTTSEVSPVSDSETIPTGRNGRFGTISGVFMPTLLTILGVIMYLRAGWVVGNTGLLGGLLVITIAFGITAATGLSLSSVTTNIRIGAGGAYSVISQSLGIEVGGAVGVPLYLSQVLATTMYIFGFREGWMWVFPNHPALAVDAALFLVLFAIAYKSAGLAFKIQYVIAAVIAASLVSVGLAAATGSMQYEPQLWGSAAQSGATPALLTADFWVVFAVFFPAATGIMAGANMSGELEDPRKSIPVGTMSAIAVSFVIYVVLAYWLARSASPAELRTNFTVMIDKAFWGPAVLGGLLGATFSSALASMVGAPRILQALASHDLIPGGDFLTKTTKEGEPRNAMLITGGLILAALLLRDLNVVAPFITMFFLITYGMINGVVVIEQSLGLVSFRPLLKLPKSVPLIGLVGCIFAMFIINPSVSLIALAAVIAFYTLLIRRHLKSPFADVRSGLFVALAQWAAQKVSDLPVTQERAWKPNLLVPVRDSLELRGTHRFIEALVWPTGYVELMGMTANESKETLEPALLDIAQDLRKEGIYTRWSILDTSDDTEGFILGMEALKGSFFRPNIVFSAMPETEQEEQRLTQIFDRARANGLGMIVFAMHPKVLLGARKTLNLWVHDRNPDMELVLRRSHLNLAILIAYMVSQNWNARINVVTCVGEDRDKEDVRAELERLVNLARLPSPEIHLLEGSFQDNLAKAPHSDLDILGLSHPPDYELMRRALAETKSSCVYVADSGEESALA
jgi:solute carrier family 12 (sodium/potassium/chloride transporter), member 2